MNKIDREAREAVERLGREIVRRHVLASSVRPAARRRRWTRLVEAFDRSDIAIDPDARADYRVGAFRFIARGTNHAA